MSSLQRGATGASKPKPVNVNSLYSGRNLAAGAKPVGKHGLQSVGKTVGVVRRMPPPATLPSLKAENNGQDPTINIVPQSGGTGWNKSEAAAEPVKPISAPPSNGPDLRPTWAKPQNQEGATTPAATATPSNREFPTLAVSAQGKDAKQQNAWNSGCATSHSARTNSTSSNSAEDDRRLPSRYYDNPKQMSNASYRTRFQGSSDARVTQPNYYNQRVSESRDGDRERYDSYSESVLSNRSDEKPPATEDRRVSECFFDGETREETSTQVVPTQIEEEKFAHDVERDAAIERSRQKRMNVKPGSQPEYRLLKRPEPSDSAPTETNSEDEEEVQMTKLNKPAVRVVKRGNAEFEENELCEKAESMSVQSSYPEQSAPRAQEVKKKAETAKASNSHYEPSSQSKTNPESARNQNSAYRERIDYRQPKTDHYLSSAGGSSLAHASTNNPQPPVAPAPTENIWAKRIEERESQEREKRNSAKSLPQAIIEQHFPAVNESLSMKVDKDMARRPADVEFARATLRARRNAASNDVRKTMNREDERRNYQRERHAEQNRTREVPDRGDEEVYPTKEDNRYWHENNEYCVGYREFSHSSRGRRGGVPRGRGIRGAVRGGRGRIGYTQYQIQKRPSSAMKGHNEEESQALEADVVTMRTDVTKNTEEISQEKEELTVNRQKGDRIVSPRGKYVRGGRGRGRGRGTHYQNETRTPREDESEEVDSQVYVNNRRGRGSHTRPRRTNVKEDVKIKGNQQRRGSDLSSNAHDSKIDRLKSPVASSEGHDEWETASESSGRVHNRERTPSKRPQPQRKPQNSTENSEAKGRISAERIRSKNGQPARRTCHSPSDASNRRQSKEKHQQKHQNEEKAGASDGLAGLDINDVAGVVVIDSHQQDISADAMDGFEEVLNKRAKKKKLQQMMEAEERRRLQKERQLRLQTQRASRLAAKKDKKKVEQDASNSNKENKREGPEGKSEKKISVTTVWNSSHYPNELNAEAKMPKEVKETKEVKTVKDLKEFGSGQGIVIPSPIARPTPRSKSSASDTPTANQDEPQKMVELTGALSASQPLQGDDKYDFTFDPNIHEQALAKESQEKNNVAVSTGANSETGSVADDYRLKEKLNRVKELWPSETEKQSTQTLPSNVAKVKPQPQVGEPPSADIVKPESNCVSSCQVNSQRSPGLTSFSSGLGGLNFGYPMVLPEMSYSQPLHVGSLLQPPNAISPPSTLPTPGSYTQNQRPQSRAPMGESQIYISNRGMNQNMQTWPTSNSSFDTVIGYGATQPQQMQPTQQSQFPFANNGRMGHQPPPQMQQQRPPGYPNVSHPPPQSKLSGGPPLLPFNPHPMDMLSMNIPPPPPNAHNMNGPQLGGHRNDRAQFGSMMTSSFQAPPPHPQLPPPNVHQPPMQFTQPPPNLNPNMRFAQPPPAHGADLAWSKQGNHQPQTGQLYGQPNVFRGQPPMGMNRVVIPNAAENWSNMHVPNFNSMNHNQPIHRPRMGMTGKNRAHDGSGFKRGTMPGHQHQANHAATS